MARQKMLTGPGQFSKYQPWTSESQVGASDKAKDRAQTPVGRVALAAKITRSKATKVIAVLGRKDAD